MHFVIFLPMIIYEVLYTRCLRYKICSTWFLDIRISTCSNSIFRHIVFGVGGSKARKSVSIPKHGRIKDSHWEITSLGDN